MDSLLFILALLTWNSSIDSESYRNSLQPLSSIMELSTISKQKAPFTLSLKEPNIKSIKHFIRNPKRSTFITEKDLQELQSLTQDLVSRFALVSLEPPKTQMSSRPSLYEIKNMLQNQSYTLNEAVIRKVLLSLKCAKKYNISHNYRLTVIDFSLPSNQKRLWVFDLLERKLLFHTYVSHGIKSGAQISNYFSNRNNSKASSLGVYYTERAYYGRHGLAMKLDGLERGFNNRAFSRAIVMHGGWYVEESFIKKYGRAGRSWGCPVIPKTVTKPLIHAIKNENLFVAYYPDERWLLTSKFLNCGHFSPKNKLQTGIILPREYNKPREDILFADRNGNNRREMNEPIITMVAEDYMTVFKRKVPLKRMLRRQINKKEYVALSPAELTKLDRNHDLIVNQKDENSLNYIHFVIPEIKRVRGYYATEMKIIKLGKLNEIQLKNKITTPENDARGYILNYQKRPAVKLNKSDRFIRWLGV